MLRRPFIVVLLALSLAAASTGVVPSPASAGQVIDGRFPTEETFVDQTYRDLLGRSPDADGLAFWANEIRDGLPPENFVEQILLSPEFGGTIAPVVRLYDSVFGRLPDEGGLRFWVDEFRGGDSLERLTQRFIAGAEFDELTNAATTEEVVTAVYGRSLGRTPDAEGLAFWIDGVDSGQFTLERFIVEVSESPEHQGLTNSRVQAVLVYLGLQQRTPEPGGLAFWTQRLNDGLPIRSFVADVLALPEYRSRFAPAPTLTTEVVATGLSIPWDIESLPDGSLLVTERPGRLQLIPAGGGDPIEIELDDSPLVSINNSPLLVNGESGLLGLAVDPAFADNQRIYTCQGVNTGRPEAFDAVFVVAWTVNLEARVAISDELPMARGRLTFSGRHAGCQVEFDADGYLFAAIGDAAIGDVPQSPVDIGGKVLRLDVSTGSAAAGNPFQDDPDWNAGIWTYGHRNVQGLALRPGTNEMWSVEHGPSVDDEVNRLVQPGGNAGWDPRPRDASGNPSGALGYNESVPMTDFSLDDSPGSNPVFGAAWSTGSSTLALSGGDWTNGADWGAWDNALAVAALKNQTLRLLFFNDEGLYLGQRTILDGEFGRLRAVHQSPDGSLYVSTSTGDDRIIRLTPSVGAEG